VKRKRVSFAKMPIRVRQPDGTFKVFEKKVAKPKELPLCQDCKERLVTAVGMKYCEPCK
jgi:hypothetical protein